MTWCRNMNNDYINNGYGGEKMKAVGKWVLVEKVNEKSGAIISKVDNKGVVVDCRCDKNLRDKIVYFNERKDYVKVNDFIAVHYDDILAVE